MGGEAGKPDLSEPVALMSKSRDLLGLGVLGAVGWEGWRGAMKFGTLAAANRIVCYRCFRVCFERSTKHSLKNFDIGRLGVRPMYNKSAKECMVG